MRLILDSSVQFGGFCEFGSRSGGAHGSELELTVDNWSSCLRIGANGTNLEHTVHVLDLELMAQRVSIMTSFFWACCDKGFWASCDKGAL